jgi:hypothetical protein
MPRRRSSRRAARAHDHDFEDTPLAEPAPSPKLNRCIVCQDQLTLFKVKHRRAYAHPLCAWLDRRGMAELAKTSGRWF